MFFQAPRHMDPLGALWVTLIAIGIVASIHIFHHAVNYPLKVTAQDWLRRRRERKERPDELPARWRADERVRNHALLIRAREVRAARESAGS